MSRRRKFTCGFEELSLSVLEIWGNVKQGRGEGMATAEIFVCGKELVWRFVMLF